MTIDELFANVERFSFYMQPSSEYVLFLSSELHLISSLIKKREKTFDILFLLEAFCFKTMWRN